MTDVAAEHSGELILWLRYCGDKLLSTFHPKEIARQFILLLKQLFCIQIENKGKEFSQFDCSHL